MKFTDKNGCTWYFIGEGLWVNQYGTLSDSAEYLIELDLEADKYPVTMTDCKNGRGNIYNVSDSGLNIRTELEIFLKRFINESNLSKTEKPKT